MSAEAEDSLDCLWLQYCEPWATNYKYKVARPCCYVYYVQDWIDQHSVMYQLMGVTIHQTTQNFSSRHNVDMKPLCDFGEALQSGHCVFH